MPENVKKRKTEQKKFYPGKDTGYETVELSSLKDSDGQCISVLAYLTLS